MLETKLVLDEFTGYANSPQLSRFTLRDARKLGKRYTLNSPVCLLYGFDGGAAILGFNDHTKMRSFVQQVLYNPCVNGEGLPYMLISKNEYGKLRA